MGSTHGKAEGTAQGDVREVLDRALADGTITHEQHQKMVSGPVPEKIQGGKDRMQTVLVATGVILLVAVIGFWVMMVWSDLGYHFKISMLGLSAAGMFMGSFLARRVEFDKLHFGLLAGASNLFVLGYGYWFFYELYVREATGGYTGWESIVPANRFLALGIPLVSVPLAVLCYLIYRNSRLGSQGALLSLIWGCWMIFARLAWDTDGEAGFIGLGIMGLTILVAAVASKVQWHRGRWEAWKTFYSRRTRTFNSLMSSGFVLGCLYLLLLPAAMMRQSSEWLVHGAIIILFPSFLAILYGTETGKEGLVMSACGMIILATWIAGLGFGRSGACILPLAIMTALMLIGIAFLLRRIPRREREAEILNNH